MGAHLCPKLKNGLFEQKEASNHIFYEIKVVWHPQNGDQMKSDLTSEAVWGQNRRSDLLALPGGNSGGNRGC